VDLHTFDKFDRPYQLPVVEQLTQAYPQNPVHHYAGDSCAKVREVMAPNNNNEAKTTTNSDGGVQCDLLHGSSLCKTDNIALIEKAPCGVILTSTAMNSLMDNSVYFGPNGQWTQLAKEGCIRDVTCFGDEQRKLERNFVFNKEGATINHKFCIAITTGKCQKHSGRVGLQDGKACETKISQFTRDELFLQNICTAYQEPIPPPYDMYVAGKKI
jgi:hypothetical protein